MSLSKGIIGAMQSLVLEGRQVTGKALGPYREEGKLPVVVYGHGIKESGNYFVSLKDFNKVYEEAGESTVITLEYDGKSKDTLIHDVARHPLSGTVIHADFYAIDANKPVEVAVELKFVGVAPAVKNLGGILVRVMYELEISVLPKHLPHELEVDLSKLENLHDQVTAGDIKLPESAKLMVDTKEVIAIVSEPKEEEEEVAAPESLEDAVAVEEKGKKAEEGAETESGESKGESKEKEPEKGSK